MKIFDFDGPLMLLLRKLWAILIAGFLFLLFCIPVFTAGLSVTALYDVVEKNLKNNRAYVHTAFFESVKKNFRQALPAGAVIAGALLIFEWDVYILKLLLDRGNPAGNLYVLIRVFQFLLIIYSVWLFPQIAIFENSMKQILKNSLLLMLRHLPASAAIFLLLIFGALVIYLIPLSVIIMPVIILWLISGILDKIFEKYTKAFTAAK